jgi:hypothetical protein
VIHQKQRLVFGIIAFLLCAITAYSSNAQGGMEENPNIQWSIPEEFCLSDCTRARSTMSGDLIIARNRSFVYFANDGSDAVQYEFGSPLLSTVTSTFVPLDGNQIAVFETNSFTPSSGLYRVDLNTGQQNSIELPEYLQPCIGNDMGQFAHLNLSRIGNSSVVACTYRSVYVVDIVTGAVQELVTFPDELSPSHPALRPWKSVIGGQDGSVYLLVSTRTVEYLIPGFSPDTTATDIFYVIYRSLNEPSWEAIPISMNDVASDGMNQDNGGFLVLVAVDTSGNMYFQREWKSFPDEHHIEVTKLNHQGQVLWQITEQDLGANVRFHEIIMEDTLLVFDDVAQTFHSPLVSSEVTNPIPTAGPDQTLTDTDASSSEPVTLDGSASTDPDGTIVSYSWTENDVEIATGVTPTVELPVGEHTITLTVTDDDGLTASDTVVITVQAASTSARVTANLQALYTFDEGGGLLINDVSGVGAPMDLTIDNQYAVTWAAGG